MISEDAEIAELRGRLFTARCEIDDLEADNASLRTENERLRELVIGLDYCTRNHQHCCVCGERCPLHDANEPYECRSGRMMSELGIETKDIYD